MTERHDRCNHYSVVSRLSTSTSVSPRAAPVPTARTTPRPLDTGSRHAPRTTAPRHGRAIRSQSNGTVPYAGSPKMSDFVAFEEPCTGQGPRHWSPRRTVGSNCKRRRTSRIAIRSQSSRKSTPGIVSPPFAGTEKRNWYWNQPRGLTRRQSRQHGSPGPIQTSRPRIVGRRASPSWRLPASNVLPC